MTKLSFYLRQLSHRVWFLPAVFSLIALATVATAFLLARLAPEELPYTISQSAIESVLEVMASSLLTVAVFALSTLVSALSSASSSATPRAVPLIVGDLGAQTSISVFIGAFLYSILGILGLSAGIYSSAGRMLLFGVTLGVVGIVVFALIRWIAQISDIGRVGHSIDRVEEATQSALDTLSEHSLFDCRELQGEVRGEEVFSERIGYVQHFDPSRLQELAKRHDISLTVLARPGTYVSPIRSLLAVDGALDDEVRKDLVSAFVVGDQRSFEHDPRFGIIVLAEIGDRALSPGVNDPGTAIDVIGTLTRILSGWQADAQGEEVKNDRVAVVPLAANDLIEDAFRPLARDGAGMIEVVLRLLNGLQVIARSNPFLREAALEAANDVTNRAWKELTSPADLRALEHASAVP